MRRTHTQRDSMTDGRRATQCLVRSLSSGEGNEDMACNWETVTINTRPAKPEDRRQDKDRYSYGRGLDWNTVIG